MAATPTDIHDVAAVEATLKGIPQKAMTLGEPGAKVKVVEFGDLKCPVCKAFSEQIVPSLIETQVRAGETAIEFRNFTIIDAESTPAGAAALAAGEQGRGWNFVELFYRNQGNETDHYVERRIPDRGGEKGRRQGHRKMEPGTAEQPHAWRRSRRRPPKPKSLGFGGTPSFAVEGPATEGLEAIGFPESSGDLEAAIAKAR